MTPIVQITGNVTYPIVLDPSSFIFDSRKIEWHDFVTGRITLEDVLENKRDERAGAALPRLIEIGVKYEKERWVTDSFVIPVAPFLNHAEPSEKASQVRLWRGDDNEEVALPITIFKKGVFAFSKLGKILTVDGPLHFYDLDSYKEIPITCIKKIMID